MPHPFLNLNRDNESQVNGIESLWNQVDDMKSHDEGSDSGDQRITRQISVCGHTEHFVFRGKQVVSHHIEAQDDPGLVRGPSGLNS